MWDGKSFQYNFSVKDQQIAYFSFNKLKRLTFRVRGNSGSIVFSHSRVWGKSTRVYKYEQASRCHHHKQI